MWIANNVINTMRASIDFVYEKWSSFQDKRNNNNNKSLDTDLCCWIAIMHLCLTSRIYIVRQTIWADRPTEWLSEWAGESN